MAKKKIKSQQKEAGIPPEAILIKWHTPDTIITRFASNMVVQNVEGYFKLSFFEVKPEIHLVASVVPPKEVLAECVGSVVVPVHKIPAIIDVLTRQLQKFQTQMEEGLKTISPTEPKQPS